MRLELRPLLRGKLGALPLGLPRYYRAHAPAATAYTDTVFYGNGCGNVYSTATDTERWKSSITPLPLRQTNHWRKVI